jgi:hypothetical protein
MMPINAAMQKVKWLPTPSSDVTIDLLESDDDDHSQHNNHTVAMIATNDDDNNDENDNDEDNEDYEQIEVENDKYHNLDEVIDIDDEHGIPWSPFLPIIHTAIAEAPMTSNRSLKEILKLYGNDYCFTKSIEQKAITLAWQSIIGDGEEEWRIYPCAEG